MTAQTRAYQRKWSGRSVPAADVLDARRPAPETLLAKTQNAAIAPAYTIDQAIRRRARILHSWPCECSGDAESVLAAEAAGLTYVGVPVLTSLGWQSCSDGFSETIRALHLGNCNPCVAKFLQRSILRGQYQPMSRSNAEHSWK